MVAQAAQHWATLSWRAVFWMAKMTGVAASVAQSGMGGCAQERSAAYIPKQDERLEDEVQHALGQPGPAASAGQEQDDVGERGHR